MTTAVQNPQRKRGHHTDREQAEPHQFRPVDGTFYDLFTEKGIFDKKVPVDGLLYKG